MKFALLLLGFAICLPAAPAQSAAAEANTALALARDGKYELSLRHYRAALALDPALPGLHLNLGLAYFKLNRFSDAASQFEQATRSDPDNFPEPGVTGDELLRLPPL